jgi:holliday junction DNA helicase RuvA
MLSYMKPEEIASAIVQNDIKLLESIKGIGKKTAERLVLELKDKLAKHPVDSNISPLIDNTLHIDSLNALMALGINRQAAEKALKSVHSANPNLSIEDLIKLALRTL